jgi:hypothetical protein
MRLGRENKQMEGPLMKSPAALGGLSRRRSREASAAIRHRLYVISTLSAAGSPPSYYSTAAGMRATERSGRAS